MNVMKQDSMDDKIKERCKTFEKQYMQEDFNRSRSWQADKEHIKLPRYIKICVETLSRSYPEILMDQESIKNVSSRQRAQKFGLMDRPSCREAIKVKSRNLDRRNLCQATVEMLPRRYRTAIKKTEARFSKGGKTHKMNATR